MSKLDTVLARIRQLPPEEQEALAVEIQFLLDHPVESGFTLTDEQWAEVESELNNPNPELVPHDQVVAEFEQKYGR